MLIFAASGVGKTWLSLMLPSPYFVDSEDGAKLPHYQARLKEAGGLYFGVPDGAGDLATITAEVRTLTTEKHDFRTFVLDSGSKPYNTLIGKEAERLGEKDAFGASKKPAVAAIRSLINALDKLPMNVVITCHEKPQWSEGEQTGFVEDIYEKVRYELDLVLRMVKQGPKRYCIVVKSRLTGFPEGDRFEANYQEIVDRYGKDLIEAPATPVALATPDQVIEITHLLETFKVTEKEREAWNTRAKAETFEEYKQEDLAKLIAHIKSKINPTTEGKK